MSGVTLSHVRKSFGDVPAVDDVCIEIRDGELLALLGPSGCGKTTTLRIIAGFVAPNGGALRFGDRDVTRVPVHRRNVGMVFQGYALFPHLTVADNVEFGLRVRSWNKARKAQRVTEMLRWVQLDAMADRSPRALSGGQQQRVALARAMAIDPDVLLLDEPFSALDAKLRTQMRTEIRALQRDAGITSVFVTHDQDEAMAIADRIAVMNRGRVEQLGSAEDIYKRPASRFVANFVGHCNFVDGHVAAAGRFETRDGRALGFAGRHNGGPATLCFRPEDASLGARAREHHNNLPVVVESVTFLGPNSQVEVRSDAGERWLVSAPPASIARGVAPARRLQLSWPPMDTFVVD